MLGFFVKDIEMTLIEEYTEAFKAANPNANPPKITPKKSGWYTFTTSQGVQESYRESKIREMTENLQKRVKKA